MKQFVLDETVGTLLSYPSRLAAMKEEIHSAGGEDHEAIFHLDRISWAIREYEKFLMRVRDDF